LYILGLVCSRNKVLLRFCHAENILPLVASLGIFKDVDELNAENYESQRARLFRSSKITPFSSNIAFVLLKCVDGSKAIHKVQTLINELPVGVIDSGRLPCSTDDTRFGRLKESICDHTDLIKLLEQQTKCHKDICFDSDEKVEL
jgi:hypothetical protein